MGHPILNDQNIKAHSVKFIQRRTIFGKKKWWWQIKAENGNIVGGSTQGYVNRSDAEYNADSNAKSLLIMYNQSKSSFGG